MYRIRGKSRESYGLNSNKLKIKRKNGKIKGFLKKGIDLNLTPGCRLSYVWREDNFSNTVFSKKNEVFFIEQKKHKQDLI